MSETVKSVIFPLGAPVEPESFIGGAWLERLVPTGAGLDCTISNVTFAPGARNNWHRQPGGQILLVTGGEGWYQEQGGPAQKIRPGDTVVIAPGVKHWHGAAKNSFMAHIAVSTQMSRGGAEWLEPVTDEEYNALEG